MKTNDVPNKVLSRVNDRFRSDAEIQRVLKLWRKPTNNGFGGKYCNCKTKEFLNRPIDGRQDCWLCGGYTY